MYKKISISLFLSILLLFVFTSPLSAASVVENETLKQTFNLNAQIDSRIKQDNFELFLNSQALKNPVAITLENLGEEFIWPWNYQALSPVYQFDFNDRGLSYDRSQPIQISIAYHEDNEYHKQIFFYDKGQQRWRPLPSVDDPVKKIVSANIHLPYARVALMSNDRIMTVGQASWYRYKNGLFAASPDFAKGSVLRVTNLANNKSVEVTINDYGPDRALHPERVIDLDAVAFSKIASLGDGLADVKIEVLKFVNQIDREKLEAGAATPEINAQAAIVMRADDAQILYAKNADTAMPIASLTKLLAAKIFLDTKPDFKKVVAYSDADAAFNHLYVKPWESARLRLEDGETLTIENLLHAALVSSANNTVETLVRVSGLSREEFVNRMNKQAESWGAFASHFVEPTGLSPENVSSPLDYAIITRELLKDDLLKKISTTSRYSFSSLNKNKKYNLTNTNSLIQSGHFSIGLSKTGYLDEAGYCLMTQVNAPTGALIISTFNSSNRALSFEDNERLIRYGLRFLE
ncbi:MAG: RlpA-like double-psi beta-barrel domain-containing protein [Patescibacteria group bacterium]|jgi:D-alanyl-D-alanine endopeptidase (penicillin-binding protein 7)|nr:RlpA-like double-psi beta-barrel domain-containing protein [Patescibacteria group bacterium]